MFAIFLQLKTTPIHWNQLGWTNFVLLRNIIFYTTASEKMEQKTLLTTITQRHAYIFYPLPLCGFYPHLCRVIRLDLRDRCFY